VSFFVLPAYVAFEAARDLLFLDSEPDQSIVGLVLAALSLTVMPCLAWAKRRTADHLHSPTLRTDATETLLCSWLSAALLGGLVLNVIADSLRAPTRSGSAAPVASPGRILLMGRG
jgi:divalent metal cation (Fe/Co/Zn/Cd) transporter